MARSRTRAAAPRTTARSRKSDAAVEVVSEDGGMGIEDGIAIITALILIAAILLVDYHSGVRYDKGFFF